MMPWGHLAVGYLVYTVGTRLWYRRAPQDEPSLALALATQLSDLVDKPLNWWFDIFDGRGIGHSVLTVTLLCGLVFFITDRYDRRDLAAAFSVGMFSHLLADAWQAILSGRLEEASFLLWPLFPAPTYPKDSLLDHLTAWFVEIQTLRLSPSALLTSEFGIQFVLLVVLFGVWAVDGFPGVRTMWQLISRVRIDTSRTPD